MLPCWSPLMVASGPGRDALARPETRLLSRPHVHVRTTPLPRTPPAPSCGTAVHMCPHVGPARCSCTHLTYAQARSKETRREARRHDLSGGATPKGLRRRRRRRRLVPGRRRWPVRMMMMMAEACHTRT